METDVTMPFAEQLTLQIDDSAPMHLALSATLRHLPGRRQVCRGTLEDRPVVAKLFLPHRRARRDWRREVAGLTALGRFGPELLFRGPVVGQPIQVVVTGEISPAQTLGAVERATGALPDDVVLSLVELIAQLHAAGVRLADPHLDNFLLSDSGLLRCVDGGAVRAVGRPVSGAAGWHDLGRVLAQLRFSAGRDNAELARVYGVTRGVSPDPARLTRACVRWRRIRWRHYRRKVTRDCSEFVTRTGPNWRRVWRRDLDTPAFRVLLDSIDAALTGPRSTLLKQGNSATVARVETAAGDFVIKRYNIKGSGHFLRRLGRRSRCIAAWRAGHFLRLFGLPAVEPGAVVESRPARLPAPGYLVTRYAAGSASTECFGELPWSDATLRAAFAVKELFVAMQELGFSHGDLKASNLLVDHGRIALLDLEGLRWFRSRRALARAIDRDRQRFLANWSKPVRQRFAAIFEQPARGVAP